MAGRFVRKESRGNVRILALDSLETGNRLTVPRMEELAGALEAAGADRGCGAVVLTGMGDSFCRGGELGDFRKKSAMAIREFGEAFLKLHSTVTRLPRPVVAAVQGPALGGGLSLVEACDLAVASEEAAFGLPEIRAGLAPMMALAGAVRLLPRKGVMELALLGESITARRAQEIGLVNWVCPQAEVLDRALSVAGRLAAQNPTAMALCKRLYQEQDSLLYERQLAGGLNMLVALLKSDDAAEALAAQEENRPPSWRRA